MVEGKRIAAVNPDAAPAGARTIELGDARLLPGFTTVRDVGSEGFVDVALQHAVERVNFVMKDGVVYRNDTPSR